MFMVILILHDPHKLNNLLDAWELTGVTGVTIFSSSWFRKVRQFEGFRDDLPMFPGINDLYRRKEHINRTLFSVVEDEILVRRLVEATQQTIGDFNSPGTGMLIVLPISKIVGTNKIRGLE